MVSGDRSPSGGPSWFRGGGSGLPAVSRTLCRLRIVEKESSTVFDCPACGGGTSGERMSVPCDLEIHLHIVRCGSCE